jgi:two-component system, OmpR family, KDP operon response regulator KdpE
LPSALANKGRRSALQRRILVAEDDPELRGLVSEYLRGEGFEVTEAEDGAAALREARAAGPDVLVLDLNMPHMDGAAVLEEWTASQELKDVPVLIVSAGAELAEVAQRFVVRATLAKPFDMDVLRAVIVQLLAHPEAPPEGVAPTEEMHNLRQLGRGAGEAV